MPPDFSEHHPKVSVQFVELLVDRPANFEDETVSVSPLSCIEITLLMLRTDNFAVPVSSQSDGSLLTPVGSLFSRPTLSQIVHHVRLAFRALCAFLRRPGFVVRGIDRSVNHIFTRCDGLLLRPPVAVHCKAHSLVQEFTSRGSDLARPIP